MLTAKFGSIWPSCFRGEDLNVKVYDVRRTQSDGKRESGHNQGTMLTHSHLKITGLIGYDQ
jgi:hypothetical protein